MDKAKYWPSIAVLWMLLVVSLAACQFNAPEPQGLSPVSPSSTPDISRPAVTLSPTTTPNPGVTQRAAGATPTSGTPATATPPPAATPTSLPTPCPVKICQYPGHFIFDKPIAAPGRDVVDASYRYGSTQDGQREVHHGVEFLNSEGTPVLAAAAGTVIVAGNDHADIYSDWPYFYGNLVVIEHHWPDSSQPVFTLYAHLSAVETNVGDQVTAGQQIGRVGYTGSAEGSHLHFEVRVGSNTYDQTRNPELWLAGQQKDGQAQYGAIAGRIVDEYGGLIEVPNIVIERHSADGLYVIERFYLHTYAGQSVNGDDLWQENFALGDLPAGPYQVTFVARGLQTYQLEVQPGMVAFINFNAAQEQ